MQEETILSDDNLKIINQLAASYQQAWQTGQEPKLEDFLNKSSSSTRGDVFQTLLRIDLTFRHKTGKLPAIQEYIQRFPEYSAAITALYQQVIPPKVTKDSQTTPWFYLRNNLSIGPFSFDQLKQLIRAGDLRPKDRVARGGTSDWTEVGKVPGLFSSLGGGESLKPPAPGDQIRNDYVLLEKVGRGGTGEVFKAYRLSLHQEVAMKFVRHDRFVKLPSSRQKQVLDDFSKEMQATTKLRHDNIVKIGRASCRERV